MLRTSIGFSVVALLAAQHVAAVELPQIVGLWQYADRAVWIQINADGSTFQCRIPKDGPPIVAAGKFTPPSTINWENAWGAESIRYRAGELIVHANKVDKDFSYFPAKGPLATKCKEGRT